RTRHGAGGPGGDHRVHVSHLHPGRHGGHGGATGVCPRDDAGRAGALHHVDGLRAGQEPASRRRHAPLHRRDALRRGSSRRRRRDGPSEPLASPAHPRPLVAAPAAYPSITMPPSTTMACPVMKRDASLARKTMTGARSPSASPSLPPSGITCCMAMSWIASSSGDMRARWASYMGVQIAGTTLFTRMPWLAHSCATVRVHAMTAAFDAE